VYNVKEHIPNTCHPENGLESLSNFSFDEGFEDKLIPHCE
jgi:hypothetical protein